MKFNQKGQAFASYRLIIGAFIAFFILLIILGAINYFETIKTRTTHESLRSGLNAAKETPDGSVVKKKNVYFSAGSAYTRHFFSTQSGIPVECLEIIADESPMITLTGNSIKFEHANTLDIFFRCFLLKADIPGTVSIPGDCTPDISDMFCQVAIGVELTQPE